MEIEGLRQANFIMFLCAVLATLGHEQGAAQALTQGSIETRVQASLHHGCGLQRIIRPQSRGTLQAAGTLLPGAAGGSCHACALCSSLQTKQPVAGIGRWSRVTIQRLYWLALQCAMPCITLFVRHLI